MALRPASDRTPMIRDRVDALHARLAANPEFPTQGRTQFIDLERGEVRAAYTPKRVVDCFLGGRGVNMFYLANLLDPSLDPLSPDVPVIYGAGIATGIIPSASRGNLTSWSPDSRILLDSNAGDYFPSFLKLNGIDHLVLYGRAPKLTLLSITAGEVKFHDGTPYEGMDNIDLRHRIAQDFNGRWGGDLAMINTTHAGELGVRIAGVMAGPKSSHGRRREALVHEPEGNCVQEPHSPRVRPPGQGRAHEQANRDLVHGNRCCENPARTGHTVPVQAVPPDLGDGDEEQPRDGVGRGPRFGELRSVPLRDDGMLPVSRELPAAERRAVVVPVGPGSYVPREARRLPRV